MKKNRIFCRLAALALAAALTVGLSVPAMAVSFTDVPDSHWAAKEISRCTALGIFQGESASTFGLKKPMTRAAFAVVLCRFFGWDTAKRTQTPYSDVPADKWYAGAVSAAYENGAVTTQRLTFRPNDPITREEMAVMLIRALGYGSIAGLAQDLDLPFTDVTSNDGYITMAYHMGLVTGTTATTFSPDATATREQAAVLLIRLYDKLHSAAPNTVGIVTEAAESAALADFETIAIAGGKLSVAGKNAVFSSTLDDAAATASAARANGSKVLLYVTAKSTILKATAAQTAEVLAKEVTEGGCDGLYLDVPALESANQAKFTALVQAVDAALGGKTFYLAAEAPTRSGTTYGGYDYAALAGIADRLVLRAASPESVTGSFPTAPVEPVEEVYYALSKLDPISNVTLLVSSEGSLWKGRSEAGPITGLAVEELLANGASSYYSDRYGCAYLRSGSTTVWYLDEAACVQRMQLARLLGVDELCVSDVTGASAGFLNGLQ